MKKSSVALFIAAVFSAPLFAQVDPCSYTTQLTGGTTAEITNEWQKTGAIDNTDYEYELWHNVNTSDNKVSIKIYGADKGGGAAFRGDWNETNTNFDYLARVGYKFEKGGNGSGKLYTEYDDIFADYSYDRSPRLTGSNYSYIGIYGWARSSNEANLVEYYIVDDWWGNASQSDDSPVGPATICDNKCSAIGSDIMIDGGTYKVYKNERKNEPSIDGDTDFDQYFSIRQGTRQCGTISITEHFKEWEERGLKLGKLYEAKLLAEVGAYSPSTTTGYIDYRYAAMRMGSPIPDGKFGLTLNESPSAGGRATRSPVSATGYDPGARVTLTATPNDGWAFAGWRGDVSSCDETTDITMDKNKNVTAMFAQLGGVELIKDGDFPGSSLSQNWNLNVFDGAEASGSINNNEFTVDITKAADDGVTHQPQLVQSGIHLEKGVKYKFSFDASAGAARTMEVLIQMPVDPWTDFANKTFDLTTEPKSFEYEFEMEADTYQNGRLGFNFGGSMDRVTLSNIKLSAVSDFEGCVDNGGGDDPGNGDDPGGKDKDPAPIAFNKARLAANFSVQPMSGKALLVKASQPATVEIYDLKGNKAAKFNVQSGSQTVNLPLPGGVYFAKAHGKQSVMFVLK